MPRSRCRGIRLSVFLCLLLGLALVTRDSKGENQSNPYSRELLVIYQAAITAKDKAALPTDTVVLASYGRLLLVERTTEIEPGYLKRIKTLPGVSAIQRSYEVIALADHSFPQQTPGSTSSKLPVGAPAEACQLAMTCKNGNNPYWAHDAVDAELMHFKLKKMGVTTSAKVAVVDSGFDRKQESHYVTEGSIITRPGVESGETHPVSKYIKISEKGPVVGNPDTDESGHGTMVASVIAGENKLGIGRNLSLSVYRVTKPGSTGSTSSSWLEMAIFKACEENRDPDGLAIINVSWGGRLDEAGFKRDEDDKAKKELLEAYAEKGCLVVKAAGNDNFRASSKENLEDAYLRVGAIDPSLELASFSTNGEVQGPGGDIYTLESTTAENKAAESKRCGGSFDDGKESASPKRFVNGTSFAAPLVAALASQVIRVLKTSDDFKALPNRQRIALVNRIISVSSVNGSVNGLRAVVLADLWNKASESERLLALGENGKTELRQLIDNNHDEVCEKKAFPCANRQICANLTMCFSIGRAQIALCPNPNPELFVNLAQTAFSHNAFELGYRYLRQAETVAPDAVAKLRATAMNKYFERKKITPTSSSPKGPYATNPYEEVDVNFVKTILAPHLHEKSKTPNPPKEFIEQLTMGVLQSSEVKDSLGMGVDPETGEDRGSNQTMDAVAAMLGSTRRILGEKGFSNFLKRYIQTFNKKMNDRELFLKEFKLNTILHTDAVPAARVLSHLIEQEPEGSALRPELLDLEKQVLLEMMKHNQHYGNYTQVLVFDSEDYPSRSMFNPMLSRNLELTKEGLRRDKVEKLSSVQAHHLIGNAEKLSDNSLEQADALLKVLSRISTGRGWGETDDDEMLDNLFLKMETIFLSASAEDKAEIQKRLLETLRKADSADIVGRILSGYWDSDKLAEKKFGLLYSDSKTKEKKKNFRDLTFLDRPTVEMLSLKIAMSLESLDPSFMESAWTRHGLMEGLGYAWRFIAMADKLPEGEVTLVKFEKERANRLTPSTEPTLKKSPGTKQEVLDNYFAKLKILNEDPKSGDHLGSAMKAGFYVRDYQMTSDPLTREFFLSLVTKKEWERGATSISQSNAKNRINAFWVSDLIHSVNRTIIRKPIK